MINILKNYKEVILINKLTITATILVISLFGNFITIFDKFNEKHDFKIENRINELIDLHNKLSNEKNPLLIYEYGRKIDTLMLILNERKDFLKKEFYIKLAKEVSKKYEIENWRIMYGIWMWESTLNAKAKGDGIKDSNGVFIPNTWRAFGIGQVWVSTAQHHYDKNISKEDLLNPIICAYVSAKVYKDYSIRYKNNINYTLSAYQRGPGNTDYYFANKIAPPNIFTYVNNVLIEAVKVEE